MTRAIVYVHHKSFIWINLPPKLQNFVNPKQAVNTAGLDIQYEPTKNQFANEPEGLRHFRDHRWKALGEENPDLLCIFFSDHFLTSYFLKQVKAWPQQKYAQQIWIRLVE